MTSPLLAIALLAGQAAGADPMADLQPATEAAILAGGKACVGATVDPAGQAARVAGWQQQALPQQDGKTSDGNMVVRGNVRVIYKTGIDGGCVVFAKPDAAFDTTAFYADLGKAVGATIVTDPKEPVTKLPNGEVLIAQVTTQGDTRLVMLVVGNPNGQYATQKGK